MLDGRVLEASQVEYKPFGKPPLQREMAHFDPLMWVIENPATGLLKTRPFMERLAWVGVTYCKYGTPYRKQTRLWTNMRWRPSRGLCRSGSRCDAWEDKKTSEGRPRGKNGKSRAPGGWSVDGPLFWFLCSSQICVPPYSFLKEGF